MSTTVSTDSIRNGVDTGQLFATLDAIDAQPELGRFQFRVTNRWIAGAHNTGTIREFYGAGQEDASRAEAFEVDAGEPAVLCGTDTGPNPRRSSSPPSPRASRRRSSTSRLHGR